MRALSFVGRWSMTAFLALSIIVIAHGAGGKRPLCKIISLSGGVCVDTKCSISSYSQTLIREAPPYKIHSAFTFDIVNRHGRNDGHIKERNIEGARIDYRIIDNIGQVTANTMSVKKWGFFPLWQIAPLCGRERWKRNKSYTEIVGERPRGLAAYILNTNPNLQRVRRIGWMDKRKLDWSYPCPRASLSKIRRFVCGVCQTPRFCNSDIGFTQRAHGITMLLGGIAFCLPNNSNIIAVSDNQCKDGRTGSGNERPKSRQLSLALATFVSLGLLAIGGVLSRHAIYTCTYRNDSSYYLFLLISVVLAFVSILLLATIFGFFPTSPLPHLDLFSKVGKTDIFSADCLHRC